MQMSWYIGEVYHIDFLDLFYFLFFIYFEMMFLHTFTI